MGRKESNQTKKQTPHLYDTLNIVNLYWHFGYPQLKQCYGKQTVSLNFQEISECLFLIKVIIFIKNIRTVFSTF